MKPNVRRFLMVAACSFSLLAGCDDDDAPKGGGDAGDAGGTGDAKADGTVGTGGATGTGGADAAAPSGTGGSTGANLDGGANADTTPGTGDGGGDTAGAGTSTSLMVVAETGGTLTLGGATLAIPAGALGATETITMSAIAPGNDPWTANISGLIYNLEPDGLQFQVPAALSLPVGTVPANRDATIAWLDDASGQWFPVQSTVEGGKVSGAISHFSGYAVLLLEKNNYCPFSGACGGELDGTWQYEEACQKPPESQPIACGTAPPIQIRTAYDLGGTVTIAQGRYTSTQTVTVRNSAFFTAACLAAINQPTMMYEDCAALQEGLRTDKMAEWTCAGTLAQGCSCALDSVLEQPSMGTATVVGQKVTITKDGDTPGQPADYCVKGESLILRDASGAVYTAIKQ
jgi:hypothetical protein